MKRPPLGPGGAATVFTLGLLGALKALALIGMAEALARGIVGVIAHDTAAWQRALLVGVGAGLVADEDGHEGAPPVVSAVARRECRAP